MYVCMCVWGVCLCIFFFVFVKYGCLCCVIVSMCVYIFTSAAWIGRMQVGGQKTKVITAAHRSTHLTQSAYWRSVARNFSSTDSREASDRSVAWMYFCTPTSDFFSASKELEYNIFFLTYLGEEKQIQMIKLNYLVGKIEESYLSGVGTPRHQEQLLFFGTLGGTLALMHVFEIEQAISEA